MRLKLRLEFKAETEAEDVAGAEANTIPPPSTQPPLLNAEAGADPEAGVGAEAEG